MRFINSWSNGDEKAEIINCAAKSLSSLSLPHCGKALF